MSKSKSKNFLPETKQYIEFLEKRLASKNYKANVSDDEYAKTKGKLDKARLVLKLLSKQR